MKFWHWLIKKFEMLRIKLLRPYCTHCILFFLRLYLNQIEFLNWNNNWKVWKERSHRITVRETYCDVAVSVFDHVPLSLIPPTTLCKLQDWFTTEVKNLTAVFTYSNWFSGQLESYIKLLPVHTLWARLFDLVYRLFTNPTSFIHFSQILVSNQFFLIRKLHKTNYSM